MPYLMSREYKSSDIENIAELMKSHFEPSLVPQRKLIFDWVARHNPSANGHSCYLVVEDNNRIVAYEGRMPVDLMINGKIEKGYFFHDTLVHPDYRRRGLGLALVNELKNTWENTTDTFAVGVWMNQFTHDILRRRKYHEISASYFIKPISPESSLARVTRSRLLARLIALPIKGLTGINELWVSGHGNAGLTSRQIARFDDRFDDFARRVSGKFRLIVLRHSGYLNWKYVDKPFASYAIFSAERNGNLAGYIILLRKQIGNNKVGIIVDILADPDDSNAISFLCHVATGYFKREKVNFIVSVLTNENFVKIFKRHLFFKRRKIAPVMIGNLHKHDSPELIKDISNWFLTCGDSDGFIWD